MSYASLIEPKAYMQNGKAQGDPYYSVEAIFDPEDMDNFMVMTEGTGWEKCNFPAKLVELAKMEWPNIVVKDAVAAKEMQWPVLDGTARADEAKAKDKNQEHFRGKKVVRFKASLKNPPDLVVAQNGEWVTLRRDAEKDLATMNNCFVSGYYAEANITCVPMTVTGTQYIPSYANAIAFDREGERLGGMSNEDRFGGVRGGQSDHDPTQGLDDEIPF
jgi:hypothetical protein